MSITTFTDLIAAPKSEKVFLVEIYPSHRVSDWTQHAGDVYYSAVGTVDIQSVDEDGTVLTEADSIAEMSAGTWYYDGTNLYVQATAGTPYANLIVAHYKLYFATIDKIFNNKFYEPFVSGLPSIKQNKAELFWGVSIISNGRVSLSNPDGYFDTTFESYAWANKRITVKAGGEDLPYSEYATMFDGLIRKKELRTGRIQFDFEDRKQEWEDSLPFNVHTVAAYPYLNAEDVGKPIPQVWGSVFEMPVVCYNRDDTGTSTYFFKVADTSTHSVNALSQAYVNGQSVNFKTSDTSIAEFGLSSTVFTVGDDVTVDVIGYQSGTVVLENPVDVVREIGVLLGVTESQWDTAARATAKTAAADFPIGLALYKFGSVIDAVSEIMRSCLGNFYANNEGDYAISIWTPDMPASPTQVTYDDIEEGSFRAKSQAKDIRKIVRCGYRRNWAGNKYAYASKTSTETEKLYDITRSRTVPTLLSTAAGAEIWLGRMRLLYEGSTIIMSFTHKLALAAKNIGDRFQLSFKRRAVDSNFSWIDTKNVEIQKIEKDFIRAEIEITVDDLKGIGSDVGHWAPATLTFPDYIGGRTITAWESTFSEAERAHAHAAWGFWTDDDGLIDPADNRTLNRSKWW